jgi:hypothetical protein
MPAGSDDLAALPVLPVRYRPLGVRVASLAFGAVLVVTVVAVWLTLPPSTQAGFTFPQRATVAGMMLAAAVVAHAMSRCRVDADEQGLTVVNGYRSHRLEWEEVVAVSLRPGNPWAVLDLSDGTTRSAMGIQGSDGQRARRQARELRALVEAHSGAEPEG